MCHNIKPNLLCFLLPQASLMTEENTTNPFTLDNTQKESMVSFAIGTFILAIVFLLGVPGNLFIIWSILARTRKRSVTTLIILNLACADGAIMCLTVFFIVYLAKQSWVFGRPMCKLLFYLCNTNMYASIMLITLMSLHRLATVLRPQGAHIFRRRRNVLSILIVLWVLVFTLSIPALIFREEIVENNNRLLCLHNHTDPKYVCMSHCYYNNHTVTVKCKSNTHCTITVVHAILHTIVLNTTTITINTYNIITTYYTTALLLYFYILPLSNTA